MTLLMYILNENDFEMIMLNIEDPKKKDQTVYLYDFD